MTRTCQTKAQTEDQKGQNQDKRDINGYQAKFCNTFSSVYVSLRNTSRRPRHTYTTGTTVLFYGVSM